MTSTPYDNVIVQTWDGVRITRGRRIANGLRKYPAKIEDWTCELNPARFGNNNFQMGV